MTTAGASTERHPYDDDAVMVALDDLLAVARENMSSWLAVMDRIALIREQRRLGVPYTQMSIDSPSPPVIDAVSRNQERLTTAAAVLRRALAHALAEEGLSHAEIARLFGVSRQRVGMLLRPETTATSETAVAPDTADIEDLTGSNAADGEYL